MLKILLLFVSIIFASGIELDHQKVLFLIKEVKTSGLKFHRNGSVHTSKKASSHLLYKYNYVRGFFFTKDVKVSDFVEKIASKSSTTGEIYYIELKNGKKIPTQKWFEDKLKEFKQKKE